MKKRMSVLEGLWAGTEASLYEWLKLEDTIADRMSAGWKEDDEDDGDDDRPYLLSIENGVATVSINGPMTNRDAWYNEYLGIASYNAIREAVAYAASNEEVKHIVLDINSGGGPVNGVSDVSNLISVVNARIKPITAFTDGSMCSAAYWLACSAGDIYATNVSTVGSIGVIATHMEYSKQLKEDGVTVNVMRAGKYKALINSVEPLSETGREQMQAQLDAAYKVFVQHVAKARNQSYDFVDASMAQGREFFGEAALAANLVDGIESFDNLMSRINAKILDNSNPFSDNPRNLTHGVDNMKVNKKALTEQEIAAIAAGASINASVQSGETNEEAAENAASDAAAEADASAQGEGSEAAANAEASAAAEQQDGNQLMAFLQAQVKDKDSALLAANLEIAGLKAKVAEQEASFQSLVDIAAKSISNMQIAMSMSAYDASTVSATQVLADHKRVSEQFASKFKAGGVAAVDAAEASKGGASVDPMHFARLAAVRSTAKAK